MAIPALDTTIGGAASNSYVTLAEAEAYFEARLDSELWLETESDNRTRALLKATWRLGQLNWLGSPVTSTQRLAWPRIGVSKRDGANICIYNWAGSSSSGYGEEYRTDEIPDLIKEAQCEFAFAYLEGFDDGKGDQVESYSMEGLNVKKRLSKPQGSLPAEVSRLLSGLFQGLKLRRG